MERAPFKFTKEYVEVMGGMKDPCYKEFERLFVEGFKAARANSQIALGLVEIMMYQSNYPCFTGSRYGGGKSQRRFEKRLMLNVSSKQIEKRARSLIRKSRDHWGTNAYDKFQKWTNGYAI
jgi:phosphatidylinositol kinase/protein kinase (PI-3  family)